MNESEAPGDYSYMPGVDGWSALQGHLSKGDCTISLGPTQWDLLDEVVVGGVEAIGNAVERYALDNNGSYPTPADVSVSGAIGHLVLQWPDDPVSGGYMNTGGKGEFSYSVSPDRTSYSLNAELVGGDEFDVGQWTSYLWEPLLGMRDRFKDHIAQAGVQVIKDYVDVWRLTHADALPSASELSEGGAVGLAHGWWPANPWTGASMAAGTGAGSFQYATAAGSYTLTVREAPFLDPVYDGAYPEYYTAQ